MMAVPTEEPAPTVEYCREASIPTATNNNAAAAATAAVVPPPQPPPALDEGGGAMATTSTADPAPSASILPTTTTNCVVAVTDLHRLIRTGNYHAVRTLIGSHPEKGGLLLKTNSIGWTALHCACANIPASVTTAEEEAEAGDAAVVRGHEEFWSWIMEEIIVEVCRRRPQEEDERERRQQQQHQQRRRRHQMAVGRNEQVTVPYGIVEGVDYDDGKDGNSRLDSGGSGTAAAAAAGTGEDESRISNRGGGGGTTSRLLGQRPAVARRVQSKKIVDQHEGLTSTLDRFFGKTFRHESLLQRLRREENGGDGEEDELRKKKTMASSSSEEKRQEPQQQQPRKMVPVSCAASGSLGDYEDHPERDCIGESRKGGGDRRRSSVSSIDLELDDVEEEEDVIKSPSPPSSFPRQDDAMSCLKRGSISSLASTSTSSNDSSAGGELLLPGKSSYCTRAPAVSEAGVDSGGREDQSDHHPWSKSISPQPVSPNCNDVVAKNTPEKTDWDKEEERDGDDDDDNNAAMEEENNSPFLQRTNACRTPFDLFFTRYLHPPPWQSTKVHDSAKKLKVEMEDLSYFLEGLFLHDEDEGCRASSMKGGRVGKRRAEEDEREEDDTRRLREARRHRNEKVRNDVRRMLVARGPVTSKEGCTVYNDGVGEDAGTISRGIMRQEEASTCSEVALPSIPVPSALLRGFWTKFIALLRASETTTTNVGRPRGGGRCRRVRKEQDRRRYYPERNSDNEAKVDNSICDHGRQGERTEICRQTDEDQKKLASHNKQPGKFIMVHALARTGCPTEVARLALALRPRQVRMRDERGRLPLHVAVSSTTATDFGPARMSVGKNDGGGAGAVMLSTPPPPNARVSMVSRVIPKFMQRPPCVQVAAANAGNSGEGTEPSSANSREHCWTPFCCSPVVEHLIRYFPDAALCSDGDGRLPLHLALTHGMTWNFGLRDVFRAAPDVVLCGGRDAATGLRPFLLAAAISSSTEIPNESTIRTVGRSECEGLSGVRQRREGNGLGAAQERARVPPSNAVRCRAMELSSVSHGMFSYLPDTSQRQALYKAEQERHLQQVTTVYQLLRLAPDAVNDGEGTQ